MKYQQPTYAREVEMDVLAKSNIQPDFSGEETRESIFALHPQVKALMGAHLPAFCRLKPEAAEILELVPIKLQPELIKDMPLDQSGKQQAGWIKRKAEKAEQEGIFQEATENEAHLPTDEKTAEVATKPPEKEDKEDAPKNAPESSEEDGGENFFPGFTSRGVEEASTGNALQKVEAPHTALKLPHQKKERVTREATPRPTNRALGRDAAERFLSYRKERQPHQHQDQGNPAPLVPCTTVPQRPPNPSHSGLRASVEKEKRGRALPLERQAINAWHEGLQRMALQTGWTPQKYVKYHRMGWFEWQKKGQPRPEYLPDPEVIAAQLKREGG